MNKNIVITYNDTKYTLEFTRDSVRQMERSGFNVNKALDTPMTSLETLFVGAFLANHGKAIKDGVPEKILKNGIPREMFGKLVDMYNEPLAAMFDEGNLEWETNF